jgi:hypothetical protein
VRLGNADWSPAVYAEIEPAGESRFELSRGRWIVQSAHPRDVGALALVVGLFVILFVVSVMLGSPTR